MCAAEDEVVCLAERKNKEKWSRDPRNTFWSNGRPPVKPFLIICFRQDTFRVPFTGADGMERW